MKLIRSTRLANNTYLFKYFSNEKTMYVVVNFATGKRTDRDQRLDYVMEFDFCNDLNKNSDLFKIFTEWKNKASTIINYKGDL